MRRSYPYNAKLDGSSQWAALQTGKLVERTPFLIASHDIALIDGEWKLLESSTGQRTLFNLRTDISETKDELERQPQIAQRLTEKLAELKKDLPADSGRRSMGVPPGKGGPGKGMGPPGALASVEVVG